MFANYVFEKSSAAYVKKIIIWDIENLMKKENLADVFLMHDFAVVWYQDDLDLRLKHTDEVFDLEEKVLLIAKPEQYIPYDVLSKFTQYTLQMNELFPLLNSEELHNLKRTDKDLLVQVYAKNFSNYKRREETKFYVETQVRSRDNVELYLSYQLKLLQKQLEETSTYREWYELARNKAKIEVLAAQYECNTNLEDVNEKFLTFVKEDYGKLSGVLSKKSPIFVSNAMEYMKDSSNRFVVIVMDGMSEFDWEILQDSFEGITYQRDEMFAMIPTTTSISRQCLLSNKYPSQLENPWSQSKEKKEFFECAKALGFQDNQIGYERGYDAEFGMFVKCGAVIVNDIDDLVHGQQQGRVGMYHDINTMSKQKKLRKLVDRLIKSGFDIYISSDHGNTPCTGTGRLMGTGVETETKSKRMVVLKDFANKEELIEKRNLTEHPKYYLPKEYDYLICPAGKSFDAKGSDVMSHGGTTIDEVVVPFIKIKAVDNNG